jgi:hypothetical protein
LDIDPIEPIRSVAWRKTVVAGVHTRTIQASSSFRSPNRAVVVLDILGLISLTVLLVRAVRGSIPTDGKIHGVERVPDYLPGHFEEMWIVSEERFVQE